MSERVDAIEKLINEGEEIQVLIADLASKVWDHVPHFPECERPIDNATNGVDNLVDYLEDQKKAAKIEEEANATAGEDLSGRPEVAAPEA